MSYFLGVTKVKLRDYLIGTSVEGVHIALWLYIGKSLERFSDINQKLKVQKAADEEESTQDQIEFFLLAFEIVMVFVVGFMVSYKAKVELDKRLEQSKYHDEEQKKIVGQTE